jgi:hypothetical protein
MNFHTANFQKKFNQQSETKEIFLRMNQSILLPTNLLSDSKAGTSKAGQLIYSLLTCHENLHHFFHGAV